MKTTQRVICILLVLLTFIPMIPKTHALNYDVLPDTFYLTQKEKDTCTLCSTTMMIRAALYRRNDSRWSSVTETTLRPAAWWGNDGLRHTFNFKIGQTFVNIDYQSISDGISTKALKQALDAHPEGIVLYCGKAPHAVFLMGYEGNTFYCAETVQGYSGKPIKLSASTLGKKYGSQENILKNVTAYWYIVNCLQFDDFGTCNCSTSRAGMYVCQASSSPLKIRSGHGIRYSVLATVPAGEEVIVLGATDKWAHVVYNGIEGYASMDYLKLKPCNHSYKIEAQKPTCVEDGYTKSTCTKCGFSFREKVQKTGEHAYSNWTKQEAGVYTGTCTACATTTTKNAITGTITADALRIREHAGTHYRCLGYITHGTRVDIIEQKQVGNTIWGRVQAGWVSLDYVKLDNIPEPTPMKAVVTTYCLRIRANAGTKYAITGYLYEGDVIEITDTQTVGQTIWGKTTQGWVSMDYVQIQTEAPQHITGVVTCDCLRIRAGAGTSNKTVGFLTQGAKIEILEQTNVGNTIWGRTKDGWVCMTYIKIVQ